MEAAGIALRVFGMPLRCYCPSIEPLNVISRLPLIAHADSLYAYSRKFVRQEMFSILKTESCRCLSSKRSGISNINLFVLLLTHIMAIGNCLSHSAHRRIQSVNTDWVGVLSMLDSVNLDTNEA